VPTHCVANLDNLHTLPRDAFRHRVAKLPASRMSQARQVLIAATGYYKIQKGHRADGTL